MKNPFKRIKTFYREFCAFRVWRRYRKNYPFEPQKHEAKAVEVLYSTSIPFEVSKDKEFGDIRKSLMPKFAKALVGELESRDAIDFEITPLPQFETTTYALRTKIWVVDAPYSKNRTERKKTNEQQ